MSKGTDTDRTYEATRRTRAPRGALVKNAAVCRATVLQSDIMLDDSAVTS